VLVLFLVSGSSLYEKVHCEAKIDHDLGDRDTGVPNYLLASTRGK
jgi:hypothetical protein